MAEFVETVRTMHRMCETNKKSCSFCPLSKGKTNFNAKKCDIVLLDKTDCEEAEQIIMQWAKEHPRISNTDKLYQLIEENFSTSIARYFKEAVIEKFSEDYLKDFWNQEWKAPREKAYES